MQQIKYSSITPEFEIRHGVRAIDVIKLIVYNKLQSQYLHDQKKNKRKSLRSRKSNKKSKKSKKNLKKKKSLKK